MHAGARRKQQHDPGGNSPALPLSLKLTLLTVFFPDQLSLFIAGLRITEVRLVFLIFAPMVFFLTLKKIGSPRYRFVVSDLFVVLASLWMFVGPAVRNGIEESAVHSGPIVLEYLIAYLSVRVLLTEKDHALAFVNMLCLVTAFVGLTGILDAATGDFFIRNLLAQFGLPAHEWILNADHFRFGLRRAVGPLEHPILFGFVCSVGLLLSISTKIQRKKFCIFGCLTGTLLAGSTAPLQVVIMGCGLFVYSKIFDAIKGKWIILWSAIFSVFLIIFMSTDTPFGHLIDLLTIDPATAYYRLYIWRSVGPGILQNPFFTVLEGEYDYDGGTVNSVWLVLSLDYGMICAIFVALSIFGACSRPTRNADSNLSDVEKTIARTTTILLMLSIFMGLTVHLWGASWVLVGLLTGLRANLGEAAALKAIKNSEVDGSRHGKIVEDTKERPSTLPFLPRTVPTDVA